MRSMTSDFLHVCAVAEAVVASMCMMTTQITALVEMVFYILFGYCHCAVFASIRQRADL